MKVMVYRYGLLKPIEQNETVRQTMLLAHRYRNTLVEIEQGRRAAVRHAESIHGDAPALLHAIEEAEKGVLSALALRNAARIQRGNKRDEREIKEQVQFSSDAKKNAISVWREYRRSLATDTALQTERDQINELAADLRRSARAYCGVYWGTYLLAEAADEASRAMPLYDGGKPNNPRFIRWQGEGRVGVQLQGGLASQKVFETDNRLRIDSMSEIAWFSPVRGERRRASRTHLRIRVGSHGDRSPIWAVFPMIMHRPLPDGSIIKNAVVNLRKIGPREEWSVHITVALADNASEISRPESGTLALDVGWRRMEQGIRIARWVDDAGKEGEERMPEELIQAFQKADDLRSIRDQSFNTARALLVSTLEAMELPMWLHHATHSLSQWRSPARLAQLVQTWKAKRFSGDEELFVKMESWRYHDFHLWEWETSQRTKALRRRREVYRCLAAKISKTYRTIVLEKFDNRRVAIAKPKRPEDEGVVAVPGARANRQIASPSELIGALENAFCDVGWVNASMTTRICHACGSVEVFDQAEKIVHVCGACRVLWDQDHNAAVNLMNRWRDQQNGDASPVGARSLKSFSKWEKTKQMVLERKARRETARNAEGKPSIE